MLHPFKSITFLCHTISYQRLRSSRVSRDVCEYTIRSSRQVLRSYSSWKTGRLEPRRLQKVHRSYSEPARFFCYCWAICHEFKCSGHTSQWPKIQPYTKLASTDTHTNLSNSSAVQKSSFFAMVFPLNYFFWLYWSLEFYGIHYWTHFVAES
jgi:hypothetical protein